MGPKPRPDVSERGADSGMGAGSGAGGVSLSSMAGVSGSGSCAASWHGAVAGYMYVARRITADWVVAKRRMAETPGIVAAMAPAVRRATMDTGAARGPMCPHQKESPERCKSGREKKKFTDSGQFHLRQDLSCLIIARLQFQDTAQVDDCLGVTFLPVQHDAA